MIRPIMKDEFFLAQKSVPAVNCEEDLQIACDLLETLEALEVQNAKITVVDKGALDCTLKARVEGAVFRAADASASNIPWGGAVR